MGRIALSSSHWILGPKITPAQDHTDPPQTHPIHTHQRTNLELLADSRLSSPNKHSHLLPVPAPLTPATSPTVSPAGSYRQRNPRHVPIVITQNVIDSVLKGLPDSPDSAKGGRSTNRPSAYGAQQQDNLVNTHLRKRPRHIPIIIQTLLSLRPLFRSHLRAATIAPRAPLQDRRIHVRT